MNKTHIIIVVAVAGCVGLLAGCPGTTEPKQKPAAFIFAVDFNAMQSNNCALVVQAAAYGWASAKVDRSLEDTKDDVARTYWRHHKPIEP